MHEDIEYARWSAAYVGNEYFYGYEAGPVARRALRYHRPLPRGSQPPTALDVGCGEGQDSVFLAASGYDVTGLDFVENALIKARRLAEIQKLDVQFVPTDLRSWNWEQQFDLVLAVNSLQFLGEDTREILQSVIAATAPGGVLGLSLFACEKGDEVRDGIYFSALETLLERFGAYAENRTWQMFETSQLWQWNARNNAPQPFVTVIAQRLR